MSATHRITRTDPLLGPFYVISMPPDRRNWSWSDDPDRALPLSADLARQLVTEYNDRLRAYAAKRGAAHAEPIPDNG